MGAGGVLSRNTSGIAIGAFETWLAAGPLLALIGNSFSDIWLASLCVMFLADSAMRSDWAWTRQLWFRLAIAFWAWATFAAAISEWPGPGLEGAAPWIRFVIGAAALQHWLGQSEARRRRMIVSMGLGLMIMVAFVLAQIPYDDGYGRFHGTFKQGPKAGWYLCGVGLPLALFLLSRANGSRLILAIAAATAVLAAVLITGEIATTLRTALGLGLFVLLAATFRQAVVAVPVIAAIVGTVAVSAPHIMERWVRGIHERLPWMPQSDYRPPMLGGLNTAFEHWLTGVGPNNYQANCLALDPAVRRVALGDEICFSHTHQIYIQVAAETGLIGLALFCAYGIGLLVAVWRPSFSNWSRSNVAAVALITVAVWPLITGANAFGQHYNFFLAFMVGWGLALAGAGADGEPDGGVA